MICRMRLKLGMLAMICIFDLFIQKHIFFLCNFDRNFIMGRWDQGMTLVAYLWFPNFIQVTRVRMECIQGSRTMNQGLDFLVKWSHYRIAVALLINSVQARIIFLIAVGVTIAPKCQLTECSNFIFGNELVPFGGGGVRGCLFETCWTDPPPPPKKKKGISHR